MKKTFTIVLAAALLLSLAACGGKTSSPTPAPKPAATSTPAPAAAPVPAVGNSEAAPPAGGVGSGETYDTGNFKALVPSGWKAFPQHDVFSDDPNEMNPNILQISKGAVSDLDLFSKPCVTVNYAGPSTTLMPPSRDFYDDVEDMADVTTGSHTWAAFRCVSMGQKMVILFEDLGNVQFQAAVAYETSGGKINLNDPDVQEILASITPSSLGDAAAAGGVHAAADTPSVNYDWWKGGWYGWWSIKNATGTYEPANKIAWDAYAEIDVDSKNTAHVRLWDTGTTKDSPLLYAYGDFAPGADERGKMTVSRVDFFPDGVWNNGMKAAEMDLSPADITVDPTDSTVSRFEDMIEIVGRYQDPGNAEDAFDYYVYLRPWGMKWEDVRGGDTTGCIYKDMMPLYYDDWYLPLLSLGYAHPLTTFQEGFQLIENAGTPAGGSLDPAAKAGAGGQVDLATLQRLLPWAKKLTYSTTYDEIAAEFGTHGLNRNSLFEGKSIYRWWATDSDYIEITFDLHEDGSETWNVTQWKGIN